MSHFAIMLDAAAAVPAYRQIADRVRGAVAAGVLVPNDRLPSSRSLAAQLGLARGTVDTAYALLAGEGFIQGRGPGGTVIAPGLPMATQQALFDAPAPARPGAPTPAPQPFRLGLPALDAFPRGLWARTTATAARQAGAAELSYPDPAGLPALREAVAAYLRVARGISCDPGGVIVTAGFQGALALVAHALMQRGDAVWIEDPGYGLARNLLAQAGARLVPVPVDDAGMIITRAPAEA